MRRGCLIAILAVILLPLGLCSYYDYRAARSALPPELEIARVFGYHEEGFLREGSALGVYRVTPESVARLAHMPEWHRTPMIRDAKGKLPDGTYPYALGASTGGGGGISIAAPSVESVLAKPGNFYKTFNHGEGMIVVEAKSGYAWYLYFG